MSMRNLKYAVQCLWEDGTFRVMTLLLVVVMSLGAAALVATSPASYEYEYEPRVTASQTHPGTVLTWEQVAGLLDLVEDAPAQEMRERYHHPAQYVAADRGIRLNEADLAWVVQTAWLEEWRILRGEIRLAVGPDDVWAIEDLANAFIARYGRKPSSVEFISIVREVNGRSIPLEARRFQVMEARIDTLEQLQRVASR